MIAGTGTVALPDPDGGAAAAGEPASWHPPVRPTWTCATDGGQWPCPDARAHLWSEFAGDPLGLAVHMSTLLMTATCDVANGRVLPPDLFNRFMAWTESMAPEPAG
jgi:hypothetical protein